MDLGLEGARALVLGSSSGLGFATATALAQEKAEVAVTSRDRDRARSAASAAGAQHALHGDLTVPGEGQRLVADAVATMDGLDICVVNTGGGTPGGIMATGGADDAGYRSMLRPALEVARAAAPHLGVRRPGRLIFLTARSAVETTPELALSGVMRSGVAAAARSLGVELAPRTLVNVVVPGQFDTPGLSRFEAARADSEGRSTAEVREEHVTQIPVGRVGEARELADVMTFLCSPRASFVNGSVVRVDGGAVRGY